MTVIKHNLNNKQRRAFRVHKRVVATTERPKLVITRSNKFIYLQVVSEAGRVVLADCDASLVKAGIIKSDLTKTQRAHATGQVLAEKLKKAKIKALAVDRGANKFHGRIKAAVEAVRENGVEV